jgi:hypothetical protein
MKKTEKKSTGSSGRKLFLAGQNILAAYTMIVAEIEERGGSGLPSDLIALHRLASDLLAIKTNSIIANYGVV